MIKKILKHPIFYLLIVVSGVFLENAFLSVGGALLGLLVIAKNKRN